MAFLLHHPIIYTGSCYTPTLLLFLLLLLLSLSLFLSPPLSLQNLFPAHFPTCHCYLSPALSLPCHSTSLSFPLFTSPSLTLRTPPSHFHLLFQSHRPSPWPSHLSLSSLSLILHFHSQPLPHSTLSVFPLPLPPLSSFYFTILPSLSPNMLHILLIQNYGIFVFYSLHYLKIHKLVNFS